MPSFGEISSAHVAALTPLPADTHPFTAGIRTAVEDYFHNAALVEKRYPAYRDPLGGAWLYAAARKRLPYLCESRVPLDYYGRLSPEDSLFAAMLDFCKGYQSFKENEVLDFLGTQLRAPNDSEDRPTCVLAIDQTTAVDLYFAWRRDWNRRHPSYA